MPNPRLAAKPALWAPRSRRSRILACPARCSTSAVAAGKSACRTARSSCRYPRRRGRLDQAGLQQLVETGVRIARQRLARAALGDKISPTLRRDAETMLARLYRDGRSLAELALRGYGEDQAADTLPQQCPYSPDDILREDWYPEPPGEQP